MIEVPEMTNEEVKECAENWAKDEEVTYTTDDVLQTIKEMKLDIEIRMCALTNAVAQVNSNYPAENTLDVAYRFEEYIITGRTKPLTEG